MECPAILHAMQGRDVMSECLPCKVLSLSFHYSLDHVVFWSRTFCSAPNGELETDRGIALPFANAGVHGRQI